MAIRWKSRLKLAVWALLFTFGLSGVLTFFTVGQQYLYQDYFQSPDFQPLIDQFAANVSLFELFDTKKEEAKQNINVTKEEIDEHRYRYGDLNGQIANIKAQYDSRIEEATVSNNEGAANSYTAERDAKIADITKNFESDEYVKNKIIKEKEDKIEEFYKKREELQSSFSRMENVFKYYFKDPTTGQVYSNLKQADLKSIKETMSKKNMLFVTSYTLGANAFNNTEVTDYIDISTTINSENKGELEGYIAIPKTVSLASPEMKQYQNYLQMQKLMWIYCVSSLISLIGSLVFAKKSKLLPDEIDGWEHYYNKIPIDIRVAIVGFAGFAAILYLFMAVDQFYYLLDYPVRFGGELLVDLVLSSIFTIIVIVFVKFLLPVFKDWNTLREEYAKGLLPKAWSKVQEAFLIKKMGIRLFFLYGFIFSVCLLLAIFSHAENLTPLHYFLLLFVLVGVPTFTYQLISTGYFNKIVQKTNELASGTLGPDLPVKGKSPYATLAGNINLLKHGVKSSQNEQAKSERLKTELITNVSHDLRTPLTSIINYTELLKAEELTEEDRSAYLEIIDRKSKRLKVLIDDLFEVSKMASGNMELKLEKVDLVQLLQQTLAEYDEAINHSTLQFRVTHTEKPIFAVVDGQKLWRVFDNLIGNILKYSLENTRVFITASINDDKDKAEITFKNISKYELGENNDELFERFKRGDTSRHTEGSGLGLAIAQSIVDLHDGKLSIETDGDLFKVTISLQLTS